MPHLAGEVGHGVVQPGEGLLCGEELVDVLHHVQVRLEGGGVNKAVCGVLEVTVEG